MALETLKDIKSIGGYDVLSERPINSTGGIDWPLFDELRETKPIYIDHDVNMISFRIQNGPIKENGVNGCMVGTLIHAAKIILEGLNEKFPSKYNDRSIHDLSMAIEAQDQRTKDRQNRGVEGLSKA